MKKIQTLEELAQGINRLHAEVQAIETEIEDLQISMDEKEDTKQEKAVKIGTMLIEAKEQLAHGKWLKWLKKNCPEISERTAQHYMAFVRGDVETLMSGNPRSRAGSSDFQNGNGKLTERQKRAIELVKQGRSYRQIGEELDTDESNIRKDPVIRQARQEIDPDAHSKITRESWGACRTLTVKERIENIEHEIDYLFDMDMYKIGRSDRTKLRTLADRINKGVDDLDG